MFTQMHQDPFVSGKTRPLGQGVYWEQGIFRDCRILFEEPNSGFTIGSEPSDGPTLLINSRSYIYLCVQGATNGCPNDYYVIEDFDGPIKVRHSGHVYEFAGQRIRLL